MKKWMTASLALALIAGVTSFGLAAEDKKEQPKSPFDKGSCCATAHAKAESCQHPCCLEAAKENKVCKKCNKEGGDKEAFAKDGCCAKAYKEGKGCSHPCCVTAAKSNGKCAKCNKEEAKKEEKK